MIKRNILSLGLLLVVGVAAVVVYNDRAQAQSTAAHHWEYCAITSLSTRWRSEANRQLESFASITYFGTGGSRTEDVVGVEFFDGNQSDAIQAAANKAIARLGADGWEFVGNVNITLSTEHGGGLLFKRQR